MKFIKRKNIDTYKPKSQRFTVEVDGRAIINTNKSLTVPIGETADRPATGVPGMLRYNSTTGVTDFEVFTGYGSWGWEKLRTTRPADISFTQVGTGNGDGTVDSVTITSGGSGLLVAPLLTIGAPNVGIDTATATCTIDINGSIDLVTVGNDGSGYLEVPTITVNIPTWTATTSYNANDQIQYGGRLYTVTIAGQTASTPPTHTTGTVTDGTADLTYAGQMPVLNVVLTGDLEYELPIIPVDSLGSISAKNVQIYVENVFQIPSVNYTVVPGGGTGAKVRFDAPVPFGKPVYACFGFDR